MGAFVQDAAGDLFGIATVYPSSGLNVNQVFEVSKPATGYASAPTIVATFSGQNVSISGLAADAAGNLFVAKNAADGSSDLFEIARFTRRLRCAEHHRAFQR